MTKVKPLSAAPPLGSHGRQASIEADLSFIGLQRTNPCLFRFSLLLSEAAGRYSHRLGILLCIQLSETIRGSQAVQSPRNVFCHFSAI
jgi:hypothetical protein